MSTSKLPGGLGIVSLTLGCTVAALLTGTASRSAADEPAADDAKAVTEVEQGPEVLKLYAGMESFQEKFTAFPQCPASHGTGISGYWG